MPVPDFSGIPFYDNHTHLLYTDKTSVTVKEFALNYYHGVRAEDENGNSLIPDDAFVHMPYQGVVRVLVHAMAQRFSCPETLEGVVEFRNSQTKTPEALRQYTAMLYKDADICGCTLDCELPMGHPDTHCFPCAVNRLFQYENVFNEQIKTAATYRELLTNVLESIDNAVSQGFKGLKGHIGEKYGGMAVQDVSPQEAEKALAAARQNNTEAVNAVYNAVFPEILRLCAELNIPLHLHSGSTGFKKRLAFYKVDPILMVPFLKRKGLLKTKIVFLHEGFPFTRNAAMMAQNFPNVWLDLSQTLPWQSLMFTTCLREALSIAPHDKIMLGSGQHWYAEMSWLSALTARKSLSAVMKSFTESGLISEKQALESARMVLSENALRLYGSKN